jgi:hypothetical protein
VLWPGALGFSTLGPIWLGTLGAVVHASCLRHLLASSALLSVRHGLAAFSRSGIAACGTGLLAWLSSTHFCCRCIQLLLLLEHHALPFHQIHIPLFQGFLILVQLYLQLL